MMRSTLATACLWVLAATAAAADRPNILLLVAEDLSPRIGSWGDTVARTPNLDELARRSVRFTRTFTTAGVCAPSRAALLTGQHQIAFGGQHMRSSTGPLGEYYAQPQVKAFPELLRAEGYFTFTDRKLDYQFSGVTAGSGPFTVWDVEGAGLHWNQRDPGQPFFGLINFIETHESGVMEMDIPPWNRKHAGTQVFRRQLGVVAPAVTSPAEVVLPPWYPDLPAVRADLARHYDNIHAMDGTVGRILMQLAADGLADQTIVIWTTDHGDGLPRAKRELYDSGLLVPMTVYVPEPLRREVGWLNQWVAGSTDDRLISFVDLGPTILALAGAEAPDDVHGRDIRGAQRPYVYASRDRIDEVQDRQRAIRDQRYKYIRSWHPEVPGGHALEYRDGLTMVRVMREAHEDGRLNRAQARWFEPAGEEQLYDLYTDPYEVDNRIDDPALQDVRRRLRNALIDWLVQVGDTSTTPESELRERLLVDGQVPETPAPAAHVTNGTLTATASDGASIGFRVDNGRWHLYNGPVPVDGTVIEVKAVRYGWRESPSVQLRAASAEQLEKASTATEA